MRYLLIVNPASGGGRHLHRLDKALRFFQKKGDTVEVVRTAAPGEGTAEVRRRCSEYDAVIAAGGDGTIREVIEGMMGSHRPLGILPWGTGNVFAREMGLPRRTKALCRLIRKGRSRTLDLGLADGRPFLMMASVGIDAFALQSMPGGTFKRFWGMGAYVWAGLRAMVRYRHPVVEVELDGAVDRGSFVLVCNTKLYGAWFVFFPQADPSDGLLDVLVFRDAGRWKFLGLVAHMFWHTWVARSAAAPGFLSRHGVYRVSSLQLRPGNPAQLDGDAWAPGFSQIEVSPGALRFLG